MRKLFTDILIIIITAICTINICFADDNITDKKEKTMGEKTLIVYYSWSGNTRSVAKKINETINGTIFELDTKTPYSKDYKEVIEEAKKQIQGGIKPELKNKFDGNIKDYDTIFIGSPNWWGTVAPVIMTFISENDLSGKTIIPCVVLNIVYTFCK